GPRPLRAQPASAAQPVVLLRRASSLARSGLHARAAAEGEGAVGRWSARPMPRRCPANTRRVGTYSALPPSVGNCEHCLYPDALSRVTSCPDGRIPGHRACRSSAAAPPPSSSPTSSGTTPAQEPPLSDTTGALGKQSSLPWSAGSLHPPAACTHDQAEAALGTPARRQVLPKTCRAGNCFSCTCWELAANNYDGPPTGSRNQPPCQTSRGVTGSFRAGTGSPVIRSRAQAHARRTPDNSVSSW